MPSPLSRDQGLDRISRLTRMVAAGALVVAGLFAALVAKAVPGKATSNGPAPTTSTSTSSTTAADNGGSAADNQSTTLAPPVQAPAPSRAPASVSSGGS
jgi:hypothetical protein